MLLPHPLSIVTIVFGLLLTMRKLDVSHRQPEQHPNVSGGDFEQWKARAMAAYGFGVWACFLKLLSDFGGSYLFPRLEPSIAVARTIGIGLDLAWVVGMIVTWRKVQLAHRLAERVGVEARRGAPAVGDSPGLEAGSQGSPPEPGT